MYMVHCTCTHCTVPYTMYALSILFHLAKVLNIELSQMAWRCFAKLPRSHGVKVVLTSKTSQLANLSVHSRVKYYKLTVVFSLFLSLSIFTMWPFYNNYWSLGYTQICHLSLSFAHEPQADDYFASEL